MSTKILFRVDGDRKIGTGHLVRSLILADIIKLKYDIDVVFVTETSKISNKILGDSQFSVISMPKIDTNFIIDASSDFGAIIFDIRDLTEDYFIKYDMVNKPVFYIDCMGQSFIVQSNSIRKYYKGSKYRIIDPIFGTMGKKKVNASVKNIVTCFGGVDLKNQVLEFISGLKYYNVEVDVIVGLGIDSSALQKLSELCFKNKNIRISRDIPKREMARIMYNADLGIFSGGNLMFESLAVGLPSIFVFQEVGQQRDTGDFPCVLRRSCSYKIDKVFWGMFDELLENRETRCLMSKLGKKTVDAKGTVRISKIILNYFKNNNLSN